MKMKIRVEEKSRLRVRPFILSMLLCLGIFSSSTQAASLEIVFKNSMWGAAIGGASGGAIWALEDNELDDLPKMMLRGAAVGILGGMLYGFYEVHSSGYVLQVKKQPALLSHQSATQEFDWNLAYLLPDIQRKSGSTHFQTTLFQSSF